MAFECHESDIARLVQNRKYEGLYSLIMNFEESNDIVHEEKAECEKEFDLISDYKQFLEQETLCKRHPIGQVTNSGFNYRLRRPSGSCYMQVE